MDLDVLPGPSLPEVARTLLARAAAASVSVPDGVARMAPACPVPVRAGRDGSPLLLPAAGSLLEQELAASAGTVIVTVPAEAPFRALRLAGQARPLGRDLVAGIGACTVEPRLVEFTGGSRAVVPIEEYRAAAPDPLWRLAPGVLRHLEQGHVADLLRCVRAHGMAAEWVTPRGLDRYGLELLALTPSGVAAVRLSFPDGPVTSLGGVPASIRTALTCRCQEPGHSCSWPNVSD